MVQTYFTGENDTIFNKNQLLNPTKRLQLVCSKSPKGNVCHGAKAFPCSFGCVLQTYDCTDARPSFSVCFEQATLHTMLTMIIFWTTKILFSLLPRCLQRVLFDEGCIYVDVPPLYKVTVT
jgi:hypothetical protein